MLLYDNLKSAVLERHGDAIRFHPTLLNFAGHYRYEPRPVAVARGNEKGRVERAVKALLANIHDEVLAKYCGCGLVVPEMLDGRRVLDLGCGSGRASMRCPSSLAPQEKLLAST